MTERAYGGIPREKMAWYPTVLAGMRTECGVCISFCHQAVYEDDDDSPVIENQFDRIVGCAGCASECPSRAIIFPSFVENRDALARLRREYGALRGGHH